MALIESQEKILKTGEKLLIRDAQAKDAASLLKYVNCVGGETEFLTFGKDEFNKTEVEEVAIIEEHKKALNKIFILAELNEEIVGVLVVGANAKARQKHSGEFGVSVRKSEWGKGIGAALIQAMLDWAKISKGLRKINLSVQVNNEAAIKLYEKFGFEKEGLVKRDLCIDGIFYDAYVMGLLLD